MVIFGFLPYRKNNFKYELVLVSTDNKLISTCILQIIYIISIFFAKI